MSRPSHPGDEAVDNFDAYRRWYLRSHEEGQPPAVPEWHQRYLAVLAGKPIHQRRAVLVGKRNAEKWAATVEWLAGAILFGFVAYIDRAPRHLHPDQPTLAVASPRHSGELLEDARNLASSWLATARPDTTPRSLLIRGAHEA